jgi:hypothetical protein
MADEIAPSSTLTFTVTRVPQVRRHRVTLLRLMTMQPQIKRGLRSLAQRRRLHDNRTTPRGGRLWNVRARATRLVTLQEGARFTLRVTPQILPDIRSVERFLEAAPAR